jgi:hypothetical protein
MPPVLLPVPGVERGQLSVPDYQEVLGVLLLGGPGEVEEAVMTVYSRL